MSTLTTNEQASLIREHILSEFVDGWDSPDSVANLRLQLKSFDHLPTLYDGAVELVQGGLFLVYHYDVNEWLDELGLLASDVALDDSDRWDLYVHIVASAIVAIAAR